MQRMSILSEIFIILSNVILQSHLIICKQSLLQNLGCGGGGKVNQPEYVAPNSKWMNFKKWVFVYYQAVTVFCGTYPFTVVKAIHSINLMHSQSLLKNHGRGVR